MSDGPKEWGPHGWKFIHYVTLGYPENPTMEDKKRYKTFFTLLQYLLPCGSCSDNYSGHIRHHPITTEILNDKQKVIKWGIDMHNIVNAQNGGKIYSEEEALKLILKEKNCANKKKHRVKILFFILVIFLIGFLFKKKLY